MSIQKHNATVSLDRLSLDELFDEAGEQHRAAHTAALTAAEHARRAGALLNEGKRRSKHGEFVARRDATGISRTQAALYMRIATKFPPRGNLPEGVTLKELGAPVAKNPPGGFLNVPALSVRTSYERNVAVSAAFSAKSLREAQLEDVLKRMRKIASEALTERDRDAYEDALNRILAVRPS